jgi:hypothetical protein
MSPLKKQRRALVRRVSYSRYSTGTGICPSGLLLKLLGRYRLSLVSLVANTQGVVVLDPVAALGGGRHGPGG